MCTWCGCWIICVESKQIYSKLKGKSPSHVHTVSSWSPADRFILWWSFLCAPPHSSTGISCFPCLAEVACDRLVTTVCAQMPFCSESHCTSLWTRRRKSIRKLLLSLPVFLVVSILHIPELSGWWSCLTMWCRWWQTRLNIYCRVDWVFCTIIIKCLLLSFIM